eukprot:gnl/Dysnectes_brevis/6130_a9259_327.p1 GENE.gnl/Dysnectes_brevis/6130_a9259_327~~gnl/Dysnectes_brevis/6130_a9259_327.p1  ORF type:complete len:1587 (-),score=561.68 gnl/Dysnectes_brevis/6130_a9259_327:424-5184(-)
MTPCHLTPHRSALPALDTDGEGVLMVGRGGGIIFNEQSHIWLPWKTAGLRELRDTSKDDVDELLMAETIPDASESRPSSADSESEEMFMAEDESESESASGDGSGGDDGLGDPDDYEDDVEDEDEDTNSEAQRLATILDESSTTKEEEESEPEVGWRTEQLSRAKIYVPSTIIEPDRSITPLPSRSTTGSNRSGLTSLLSEGASLLGAASLRQDLMTVQSSSQTQALSGRTVRSGISALTNLISSLKQASRGASQKTVQETSHRNLELAEAEQVPYRAMLLRYPAASRELLWMATNDRLRLLGGTLCFHSDQPAWLMVSTMEITVYRFQEPAPFIRIPVSARAVTVRFKLFDQEYNKATEADKVRIRDARPYIVILGPEFDPIILEFPTYSLAVRVARLMAHQAGAARPLIVRKKMLQMGTIQAIKAVSAARRVLDLTLRVPVRPAGTASLRIWLGKGRAYELRDSELWTSCDTLLCLNSEGAVAISLPPGVPHCKNHQITLSEPCKVVAARIPIAGVPRTPARLTFHVSVDELKLAAMLRASEPVQPPGMGLAGFLEMAPRPMIGDKSIIPRGALSPPWNRVWARLDQSSLAIFNGPAMTEMIASMPTFSLLSADSKHPDGIWKVDALIPRRIAMPGVFAILSAMGSVLVRAPNFDSADPSTHTWLGAIDAPRPRLTVDPLEGFYHSRHTTRHLILTEDKPEAVVASSWLASCGITDPVVFCGACESKEGGKYFLRSRPISPTGVDPSLMSSPPSMLVLTPSLLVVGGEGSGCAVELKHIARAAQGWPKNASLTVQGWRIAKVAGLSSNYIMDILAILGLKQRSTPAPPVLLKDGGTLMPCELVRVRLSSFESAKHNVGPIMSSPSGRLQKRSGRNKRMSRLGSPGFLRSSAQQVSSDLIMSSALLHTISDSVPRQSGVLAVSSDRQAVYLYESIYSPVPAHTYRAEECTFINASQGERGLLLLMVHKSLTVLACRAVQAIGLAGVSQLVARKSRFVGIGTLQLGVHRQIAAAITIENASTVVLEIQGLKPIRGSLLKSRVYDGARQFMGRPKSLILVSGTQILNIPFKKPPADVLSIINDITTFERIGIVPSMTPGKKPSNFWGVPGIISHASNNRVEVPTPPNARLFLNPQMGVHGCKVSVACGMMVISLTDNSMLIAMLGRSLVTTPGDHRSPLTALRGCIIELRSEDIWAVGPPGMRKGASNLIEKYIRRARGDGVIMLLMFDSDDILTRMSTVLQVQAPFRLESSEARDSEAARMVTKLSETMIERTGFKGEASRPPFIPTSSFPYAMQPNVTHRGPGQMPKPAIPLLFMAYVLSRPELEANVALSIFRLAARLIVQMRDDKLDIDSHLTILCQYTVQLITSALSLGDEWLGTIAEALELLSVITEIISERAVIVLTKACYNRDKELRRSAADLYSAYYSEDQVIANLDESLQQLIDAGDSAKKRGLTQGQLELLSRIGRQAITVLQQEGSRLKNTELALLNIAATDAANESRALQECVEQQKALLGRLTGEGGVTGVERSGRMLTEMFNLLFPDRVNCPPSRLWHTALTTDLKFIGSRVSGGRALRRTLQTKQEGGKRK